MGRGGCAALALAAVLLALPSGCAFRRRPPEPLVPIEPARLPVLSDDTDLASLRAAIARQPGAADAVALAATDDPEARRHLAARAFRVVQLRDPLLLTSYFEPELHARTQPDAVFRHPIYARPPDLVDVDPKQVDPDCGCRRQSGRVADGRIVPYPTRSEIDAGALAGRRLELAWTDDPIGLFVLHVQGSGRLRMDDGTSVPIQYAGTNGRPYRALGAVLVARGLLTREEATLPGIERVLAALPDAERTALMAENPRYTFFRRGSGRPVGSAGVELTPGRSVATDPALVPAGTIGYLVTPSVRRFVISQDTGAAIKGAHVDLFAGAGPEAKRFAGSMRERGTLYLLLPR